MYAEELQKAALDTRHSGQRQGAGLVGLTVRLSGRHCRAGIRTIGRLPAARDLGLSFRVVPQGPGLPWGVQCQTLFLVSKPKTKSDTAPPMAVRALVGRLETIVQDLVPLAGGLSFESLRGNADRTSGP